jgi:hypothetical protein
VLSKFYREVRLVGIVEILSTLHGEQTGVRLLRHG